MHCEAGETAARLASGWRHRVPRVRAAQGRARPEEVEGRVAPKRAPDDCCPANDETMMAMTVTKRELLWRWLGHSLAALISFVLVRIAVLYCFYAAATCTIPAGWHRLAQRVAAAGTTGVSGDLSDRRFRWKSLTSMPCASAHSMQVSPPACTVPGSWPPDGFPTWTCRSRLLWHWWRRSARRA